MSTISPANPYKMCVQCQAWVTSFTNTVDGEGLTVNQPCGHTADYKNMCPSWSPIDGCQCQEFLGHVPHGEPPK
jgi:hypothetical protein